jgi:Holliday junction resolvasome RuvABC endonuclease subunit
MPIQPSYYRPPSGSLHALRKEVEAALYLEAPWSDVRLAQLARFYKISLLPGCDGNYHIPLVYVDGVICGAPTTAADPERPGLHCRECFLEAADEFENPMRFYAKDYMSREEWDRLIQGYYSKTMNEPATLVLIGEKERSLREQAHIKKVERWQGLTEATTGATSPVEAPSVSKASRNPRVRPARAPKPTWGSQATTAADGWEFLGFDPGPRNTYWARVLVTPAGCKYISGGRIYSDVGSIALVLAKSDPKMIGIEEVGNFVKPEAKIQLKDTAKVVGLIEGVAGAMGYKSMLIAANGPSSWRKVLTGNANAGDLLVGEAVVATPNFPPRSNNHLRDATGIAMVTGMLYAEPEKYGNI